MLGFVVATRRCFVGLVVSAQGLLEWVFVDCGVMNAFLGRGYGFGFSLILGGCSAGFGFELSGGWICLVCRFWWVGCGVGFCGDCLICGLCFSWFWCEFTLVWLGVVVLVWVSGVGWLFRGFVV